jgi:hypothetical protein
MSCSVEERFVVEKCVGQCIEMKINWKKIGDKYKLKTCSK